MCLFLILDVTQVKACKCHVQVYIGLVLFCAVILHFRCLYSTCSHVLVSVTAVLETQSAFVLLEDLLYLALKG